MLINIEVDKIAPFRPPRGTDEELSITEAAEICPEHERVLLLAQSEALITFQYVFNHHLEVLEQKLLHNFLLLAS